MAIRYDKKLNNEINRIVRNYNAKIRRLENKNTDLSLPEKYSRQVVNAMKESYSNRSDLRRRLKELERFTARGGEKNITVKGITLPKHEYQTIRAYQNLVKRRINKRLKFYETTTVTSVGKKGDVTLAQTGETNYLNLLAKKEKLLDVNLSEMSVSEREMYFYTLRANARTHDINLWKKNYIKLLIDTGMVFDYDKKKLKLIKNVLEELTPTQVDKIISGENTFSNIIYHYSAIKDITDSKGREQLREDVISNFDTIHDNLVEILTSYVSHEQLEKIVSIYGKEIYS